MSGAGRSLFHDGRQSRQFHRKPRAQPGRLCAVREHRRPSPDYFLFHSGRRARLDGMALAVGGALEPAVHDRKMSRGRTGKPTSIDAPILLADGNPAGPTAADQIPKPAKRRRRDTAAFEQRIGYRFKDAALLEQPLTHISSLSGARHRAPSYHRLEFLADHVLGLVLPDTLFRTFPPADHRQLSRPPPPLAPHT